MPSRGGTSLHRRTRTTLVVALLLALLVACGGDAGPERSWRDLELTLPDGWSVFEDETTRFSIADGTVGEEGVRGTAEAAVFFTHEPRSSPEDWRELVAGTLGGELEVDRQERIGGLPATRLVFSHASNGVPMREMVVLVPAREVVVLLQPIVERGQEDGPEVFDAHLDEFEAVLSSLRFGAPADDRGE